MSGYRQSSYDPARAMEEGRPLRPYNWVQWTGVALLAVAMLVYGAYLAARLGWMRDLNIEPIYAGLPLLVVGNLLINSRRQPMPGDTPELAAARKRWLIITICICVALLGAAAVIELTGAK